MPILELTTLLAALSLASASRVSDRQMLKIVTFVGRTGAQNAIDRIGGVAKGAGDSTKSLDSMADENDHHRAKKIVPQHHDQSQGPQYPCRHLVLQRPRNR